MYIYFLIFSTDSSANWYVLDSADCFGIKALFFFVYFLSGLWMFTFGGWKVLIVLA